MRYAKKTSRVSLSVCMSHVTFLSAIQEYRFYEKCQGIMNNPVNIEMPRKLSLEEEKRHFSPNGGISVCIKTMFTDYAPYNCFLIFYGLIYCICGDAKQTLFTCEVFYVIPF
jgi:hypothetical protein